MPVKMDGDKIKHVVRENRTSNATIAESVKISSWYVRRLWTKYRSTCSLPTISSGGRPAIKAISDEKVEMVLTECIVIWLKIRIVFSTTSNNFLENLSESLVRILCRRDCSRVGRVTNALADKNISGRTVYSIMKEHGLEVVSRKGKKTQMGEVWAIVL